jgi:uncharacterized membrane protein
MEVLPDALAVTRREAVAWVLAVVAGAAFLVSTRAPRLGSRLGWVYPVVMAVAAVAVLVVDAATRFRLRGRLGLFRHRSILTVI